MYCVKEKIFLDSVQYQIYEKVARREVFDENLENYYKIHPEYNPKKKKCNHFRKFKFDDGSVEYLQHVKDFDYDTCNRKKSISVSRSRTIKSIYDIGRANYWEWWLTFTLNPEKVDRYDYSAAIKKLKNWIDYLRKRNPGMIYLVVPELHEDGAWHFHGLFSKISECEFDESGRCTDQGQKIYNVSSYDLGWTYGIRMDGSYAMVAYMTKYITKDLVESTFGKKRYWASRTCNKPEVVEYELNQSFEEILEQIDLSNARLVTKQNFINVTYIDRPIYSTNTSRFVENETNENNIGFDSGIDLEN